VKNLLESDVLTIGAGIIGASIARELSQYKLEVAVVEKSDEQKIFGHLRWVDISDVPGPNAHPWPDQESSCHLTTLCVSLFPTLVVFMVYLVRTSVLYSLPTFTTLRMT
jgi:hypothetical protein